MGLEHNTWAYKPGREERSNSEKGEESAASGSVHEEVAAGGRKSKKKEEREGRAGGELWKQGKRIASPFKSFRTLRKVVAVIPALW